MGKGAGFSALDQAVGAGCACDLSGMWGPPHLFQHDIGCPAYEGAAREAPLWDAGEVRRFAREKEARAYEPLPLESVADIPSPALVVAPVLAVVALVAWWWFGV